MNKASKLSAQDIQEIMPFDDVMRRLLRAKPQHKVAKKKKPTKNVKSGKPKE